MVRRVGLPRVRRNRIFRPYRRLRGTGSRRRNPGIHRVRRSSATLAHIAAERGHRSLYADAAAKIVAGTTSFTEIERVVGWWVR